MADAQDDGFNEDTFKALDEASAVPPAGDPATPPATPPTEPPKEEVKPVDEPKKEETPKKAPKAEEPPTDDAEKPKESIEPPKDPATPSTTDETAKPLTKDDVQEVVTNLLQTERSSSKELETTTKEVLESYYPDGLSNVLETSDGKPLKTPADVIAAAQAQGVEMTTDEAAQWLMNEQFKLDNEVKKIKDQVQSIAETTIKFKNDGIAVLQKYQPLFDGLKEKYPGLQDRVFKKLMERVKVDKDKGVILDSPDVMDWYDDYLAPYQEVFEAQGGATPPAPETPPEPPKPSTDDRLDESGDGGTSPVDDPNDFSQQVVKELAREI